VWQAALVLLILVVVWPTGGVRRRGRPLFRHTGPQWRRMYGRRALLRLGLALGAAAVLVYSGADTALERRHTAWADPREGRAEAARDALRAAGRRERARHLKTEAFPSSASDRVAQAAEPLGNREMFFICGLGAAVDWLWKSSPLSRWSRASFEAMVVGLPMLWTVQRVLGSNRPSSRDGSPRWRPFEHANAASGHAFLGAIPLWTLAARLDHSLARGAARFCGLLTGWSRLNDRKHYPSQILLGWTIAANAVIAVEAEGQSGAPSRPASVSGEPAATVPAGGDVAERRP
jgi:membrane-associated phospholipid phosphatase